MVQHCFPPPRLELAHFRTEKYVNVSLMDKKGNSGAEVGFDHVNVQNWGLKGEQLHGEVVSFQDFESGRRI